MPKCAWCPYRGSPLMLSDHAEVEHAEEFAVLKCGLRKLDEDIVSAQKQAGYLVDGDISDYNVDDEDLSDV